MKKEGTKGNHGKVIRKQFCGEKKPGVCAVQPIALDSGAKQIENQIDQTTTKINQCSLDQRLQTRQANYDLE